MNMIARENLEPTGSQKFYHAIIMEGWQSGRIRRITRGTKITILSNACQQHSIGFHKER